MSDGEKRHCQARPAGSIFSRGAGLSHYTRDFFPYIPNDATRTSGKRKLNVIILKIDNAWPNATGT
jgi:hypothetical protein